MTETQKTLDYPNSMNSNGINFLNPFSLKQKVDEMNNILPLPIEVKELIDRFCSQFGYPMDTSLQENGVVILEYPTADVYVGEEGITVDILFNP